MLHTWLGACCCAVLSWFPGAVGKGWRVAAGRRIWNWIWTPEKPELATLKLNHLRPAPRARRGPSKPVWKQSGERGKAPLLHLVIHLSVLSIQPAPHSPCRLPRPLPGTHLRASPSSFPNLCGAPNARFPLPVADVLPARSACPRISTLFPLPAPCPPPWLSPGAHLEARLARRPVMGSRAPHASIGHLAAASV